MRRNESQLIGDRGSCICLECNTRIPSQNWITCIERNCPSCGAIMVREGSPYHLYALEQRSVSDEKTESRFRRSRKKSRKSRIPVVVGEGA